MDSRVGSDGGHSVDAGIGEAGNLNAVIVGGAGDDAAVGLAGEHLADGVGIGLSRDSDSQGDDDESSHGDR